MKKKIFLIVVLLFLSPGVAKAELVVTPGPAVDERTREHLQEMQERDARRDVRERQNQQQEQNSSAGKRTPGEQQTPVAAFGDPRCPELLNRISALAPTSEMSIGELIVANGKRRAATEEYKMRCMAASGGTKETGAQSPYMCPDGSYVSRGPCIMCPDGRYVGGGVQCQMAPDGSYVPSRGNTPPRMVPNGSYIQGGIGMAMCPDGSYVAGSRCVMTPSGKYVGY